MSRHLDRQAKSRAKLREAAERYTALRGGTGTHTDVTPGKLRDGTAVAILITVEVVPDPGSTTTA